MTGQGRSRQDALVMIGGLIIVFGMWTLAEKTGLVPDVVWVWWRTLWAARSALALVVIGALLIIAAKRDTWPDVPPAGTPLYRARSDRWVAGVLGGVARYFSVDSTLVRLAFLAFAVFVNGGGALIAYLVMALVVPEEPEQGHAAGQQP